MSKDLTNMSKDGGDVDIGSAGVTSSAGGGQAHGHSKSGVWGRGFSDAAGAGFSGPAASGQNAVDAAGGDVTDNTSIGTVNIGY